MGYLRPEGLKHMGLGVWPEFHKPLRRYAADRHLAMTHVIIDAVARRLKRTGYWPVVTVEAKERSKRRRINRMVEGRQRLRRAWILLPPNSLDRRTLAALDQGTE